MRTKKPRSRKPLDPVKQFREWMKNTLRRAFFRFWERTKALQAARVDRGLYQCAGCKVVAKIEGHHIDHISPVVDPKVGFVDWNTYISRLFCSADNLQLLCKICHTTKTKLEQEERKAAKTGIYFIGKKLSQEQKDKISEGHKGQIPSNLASIQEARKCPIIATNVISGEVIEFNSLTVAAEALKVSIGNITTICKGTTKRKKANGFYFKYKEETNE